MAASLRWQRVFERHLLIVTGKGGTGRSALSAALAIKAARQGQRVLAVAMTDVLGLALHLGVTQLHYEPQQTRPGVWALAIDRTAALDEYIHLQLHLPRAAPLKPVARTFSALADTVPGIRDAVTVGKISWESWSDDWDLIVADGPPLGQIDSYLKAPASIAALVPSGRVQEQATRMAELLADPDESGLVVTTLAEELPVIETNEHLAQIDEERTCQLATLIVNGLLPSLDAEAPDDPGPLRDSAVLHHQLHQGQQRWLGELPDGIQLPYLFGMLTPTEVAARLADELP